MSFPKIPLERGVLFLLVGVVGFLLGRNGGFSAPQTPLYADSTVNSTNNMVAVAAPYMTGVSLLYVIDTRTKQLAVYEARGGSRSASRINFVAARRIDLDLRLEGYHDDSEYSFGDLAAQFRKSGWTDIRTIGAGDPAPSEAANSDSKPKTPTADGGKQ